MAIKTTRWPSHLNRRDPPTMMLSRAAWGRCRPSSIITRHVRPSRQRSPRHHLWTASFAFAAHNDPSASTSPLFQHYQIRWKRKGGASAFSEPRPPTRKQRKAYNRRKRQQYQDKIGKHSAPGAKAGYRRQWNEETFQQLLNHDNTKNEEWEQQRLEYDYGDALVDDLMGNTSSYTSLPTPEPIYLGHCHKQYYSRVKQKMELYQQQHDERIVNDTTKGALEDIGQALQLPSDHEISLVLRAYRDRYGTKRRPIGIVKALKHLLTDLSLSTFSFGEETYTTLLTCCQTPKEARRILRLMKEQQHPISSYSWAILVDIHAKLGDFEGCDAVMREMVTEGVLPSLPAYTSLLAACYKVCNNGTIPHSIRDQAAKLGWNRWKEMVVLGIEPDTMAYGALLRLIAVRGQPERAINILEEMQTMDVKPTTLCFTSALKAVSRSQQSAVRFERGASKKNKRREQITAHHGKLARKIVILAENAEVEQDDGFVAALIMCAGAAGDSATAKAILLASEVRRMDQLRTIGPDEHLKQIRGERVAGGSPQSLAGGVPMESLPNVEEPSSLNAGGRVSNAVEAQNGARDTNSSRQMKRHPGFEEREYGTDTRKLSALLFACSQAVDKEGLGMQWAGRYSKGYLCENSLRLLTTRPQPKYFNPSIPGVSSTEVGMGNISWQDEEPEHLSKSLRRAKYRGIKQDDTVGNTMEDIDEAFFNMFKDDYKEKMDNDPTLDPMLLNKEEWEALTEAKAADALRERMKQKSKEDTSSIEEAIYRESDEEWYFDNAERKWKTRKRVMESSVSLSSQTTSTEEGSDGNDLESSETDDTRETEWYFDDVERRWKTRPLLAEKRERSSELQVAPSTSSDVIQVNSDDDDDDHDHDDHEFQTFLREVKEQIKASGEDVEIDEAEARELFAITRGESLDGETSSDEEETDKGADENGNDKDFMPPDFETFFADIKDEWDITEAEAREMYDSFGTSNTDTGDDFVVPRSESAPAFAQEPKPVLELEQGMPVFQSTRYATTTKEINLERSDRRTAMELSEHGAKTTLDPIDRETDPKLEVIREALPGLPLSRAKKVLRTFEKSLNYPSMLELVPILRENMPDHLTSGWLKRQNIRNAEVVLKQAKEEGVVDVPIMNGALQVKTSAGSLDETLAYHEEEFKKNGLTPTAYSDRLVLQMLVRNNRLSRALAFKQKIEEDGRHLDVISYGSLIEYYGNHGKLGSAMLVLKECLNVHGAPPGAKSLAKLRLLCRQHDMEAKLRLEELIGKDPMEWLRHGEANLKREKSFKGRRDVNLARNRMVQA